MAFCSNCGFLTEQGKFCVNCGAPVNIPNNFNNNFPATANGNDFVTTSDQMNNNNNYVTSNPCPTGVLYQNQSVPIYPNNVNNVVQEPVVISYSNQQQFAGTSPSSTTNTFQDKSQDKEKPKKKKGCLIAVVVVVCLFLLFGMIGSCSEGSSNSSSSSSSSSASSASAKQEAKPVDKATLNTAIESAKTKIEGDYTPESWSKLAAALKSAEEVNANTDATQSEVDKAKSELNSTLSGLKEAFKPESYETMPYKEVSRNPDNFLLKKMKISGRVVQVMEGSKENNLRVATNGKYDDIVLVGYEPSLMKSRILEDDQVTIYGICLGVTSYETVLGAKITIPSMSADNIEIK